MSRERAEAPNDVGLQFGRRSKPDRADVELLAAQRSAERKREGLAGGIGRPDFAPWAAQIQERDACFALARGALRNSKNGVSARKRLTISGSSLGVAASAGSSMM